MPGQMTTFSGTEFDPMAPSAAAIKLEDIAHALSLLCRGGGHLKYFYSVGQHSINCAVEAQARNLGREVVLGCLLHDASEAYLSDIIRPVKKHLPQYLAIEQRLQAVVWEKFGLGSLSREEEDSIMMIDDILLSNEIPLLMNAKMPPKAIPLMGDCDFSLKKSTEIEQLFLQLAAAYL